MKQALAIMAVVMVALLVVSGFIVSGSMQQQEQLTAKVTQVNELKTQLKDLREAHDLQALELEGVRGIVDKQNESLSAFATDNENLKTALSEAQASAGEANAALAEKELEREAYEAAFGTEREELLKASEQQKVMIDDLGAKLTSAEKARDEALGELGALTEKAEVDRELAAEATAAMANATGLEGKVTELEAKVAELEEKAAKAEEKTAGWEEKATTAEAKSAGLEEKVAQSEAKVAELEEKATQSEAKLAELEEKATKAEEKAVAWEAKVAELQGKATRLEEGEKQHKERADLLQGEIQKFSETLAILEQYQKGSLPEQEAKDAVKAFEEAYPDSLLTFLLPLTKVE